MSPKDKAALFAKLHVKGDPLVLFNAWDPGSAKVIEQAGAEAIATSSWAVAKSQGYSDGEDLPKEIAEQVAARIVTAVSLPVSLDFEGGYTDDDGELADNIHRLLVRGIVGINFEDRVVKGQGLYETKRQSARIAAIRKASETSSVPFFINARTDLFLGRGGPPAQAAEEALERAAAYAEAGASGFFIPGLKDPALIERLCAKIALPVNIMMLDGAPSVETLASLGVARVSFGAMTYGYAAAAVQSQAERVYKHKR